QILSSDYTAGFGQLSDYAGEELLGDYVLYWESDCGYKKKKNQA
ncbi:35081_t:CDS:1, partial [Gigaspora margarita]